MSDTQEQHESSTKPQPWLDPYRFKPGQSGNPGGLRKGRTLTAILTEALDCPDSKQPGKTAAQVIAEKLVEMAADGNLKAILAVYDRTDGKPKQAIEVTDGSDAVTLAELRANNFKPGE